MTDAYAPPLKTQGIKTKIVPRIRESVEWSGEGRWVEPFVGSAAVVLNLRPDRALLGDTNVHLILFYQAIQDGTVTAGSVRAFLDREGGRLLSEGEAHYYRIRDRFNAGHDPHDFLFLNRSCFNGLMRFNGKGGFNTPFCRKPERFPKGYITRICNQVQWASDRMRGRAWEFVCSDWRETLREARSGDFVYADPPYVGRFTDYFAKWSEEDALQLEAGLKELPCSFVYSMWSENRYRKNERLHKSFSDCVIRTFPHFYHLGATEDLRGGMVEALVVG